MSNTKNNQYPANWTIEQCADWFKSKDLAAPNMVEYFLHAYGSINLENERVPEWYNLQFLDLVRSQIEEDMNNIPYIEVGRTSMTGQSLFILRMPNDPEHLPTVSQQLPTHIALWIEDMAKNQKSTPDDFKE